MQRAWLVLGRSARLGALLALVALSLLVPISNAQTPVGDEQAAEAPHPAHIHIGTCETLGEVVAPLTDVTVPEGTYGGPASADRVETSQSVVDMPLQEIIDGGHAINVHQSADEIDTYIACGDVGGVVRTDEDGRKELVIGLHELNGSGHSGVAWLGDDGDQTEVAVSLAKPDKES